MDGIGIHAAYNTLRNTTVATAQMRGAVSLGTAYAPTLPKGVFAMTLRTSYNTYGP